MKPARVIKLLPAICVCALAISLWISRTSFNFMYPDDGYRYVIGVCQQNLQTNAQLAFKNDLEAAVARRDDINVIFYSAGGDTQRQIQQIHMLLEQRADCVIVSAENLEAIEPALEEVRNKEVSLIVLSTYKNEVVCDAIIRTDYYEIGRAAGTYFMERDGEQAVCFLEIHGKPRAQSSRELQRGFRSVYDDTGIFFSYVIVGGESYRNTQERIVQSNMCDVSPQITAVFAHSDEMALGAAQVFQAHEQTPRILGIGGWDGRLSGITGVSSSRIEATVAVSSGGREAFSFAEDLMLGKTVPKEYILPFTIVNTENLDDYLSQ